MIALKNNKKEEKQVKEEILKNEVQSNNINLIKVDLVKGIQIKIINDYNNVFAPTMSIYLTNLETLIYQSREMFTYFGGRL